MKIAITGATGKLGQLIIEALLKKVPSSSIVGFARSAEAMLNPDVERRVADNNQPSELDAAFAPGDIDTLLLISGTQLGIRVTQHGNVIRAAKKAGVRRVVYTSGLHADTSTIPLSADHVATEQALQASGLEYTILRNGWYTENNTASIPQVLAVGTLLGAADHGRYASAARADYAEATAIVLATDGHAGKTYELAGDQAWTLSELAAEISSQTGKTIPYKNLPPAEYAAVLQKVGLPAEMAQMIADSQAAAAKGELFDDTRQLSTLLGRATTPLAATVANALKQL